MRSADTSPEAYAVQLRIYRSMTPERRIKIAAEMSEELTSIAAEGVRSRHPHYSEAEVRWALLRLRHGDEAFRRVWPDAPLVAP